MLNTETGTHCTGHGAPAVAVMPTAADGQAGDVKPANAVPGVLDALARMPEKTLLTEDALANALGISKRTVRRMVGRFELPPSVSFAGRSTWQAGAVLRWFEGRAERAARQAEREAAKILERSA